MLDTSGFATLYTKLAYDPVPDLTPITVLVTQSYGVVVPNSMPVKNRERHDRARESKTTRSYSRAVVGRMIPIAFINIVDERVTIGVHHG